METMTETDGQLATLEKKIDVGFARVEENFKRVDERSNKWKQGLPNGSS